mgnify:CR=1 FL=1
MKIPLQNNASISMAFYNGLLGHKQDYKKKNYEAGEFWCVDQNYVVPTRPPLCSTEIASWVEVESSNIFRLKHDAKPRGLLKALFAML